MTTASTIPAALDALVAAGERAADAVKTSLGLDVQVIDGGGKSTRQTTLIIGYAAGGLGDAVDDTQTIAGLTLIRDMESYGVACHVATWQRSGSFQSLRAAAFAVVDAFVDELTADKTLGRAVISARVAEVGYAPSIEENKGPHVAAPFRVQIEARRATR